MKHKSCQVWKIFVIDLSQSKPTIKFLILFLQEGDAPLSNQTKSGTKLIEKFEFLFLFHDSLI